jgi:hypothetical protein
VVTYKEKLLGYQAYINTGDTTAVKGKPVQVELSKDRIHFSNSSADLQWIRIYVPAKLTVKATISHYGELLFHDYLDNSIEASVYQGLIKGEVINTLSANVVQRGTIDITLKDSPSKRFIMLSSYNAQIDLKLENTHSAIFDISTDLGTFSEDLPVGFKQEKGAPFNVIDPKTKVKTQQFEKLYSGKTVTGRDIIHIKNVKGDIQITTFKKLGN